MRKHNDDLKKARSAIRNDEQQRMNRSRGSSASRGYGHAWRKARAAFLAKHPICVMCEAEGRVVAATVVDHIIPHKGDMTLFWDRSNWQPLCAHHHSVKTAKEDGGYGNGEG